MKFLGSEEGFIFFPTLRRGHLNCLFFRKSPRTCQSAFNGENKNDCKGKMFWLTRSVAGLSGRIPVQKFNETCYKTITSIIKSETMLPKVMNFVGFELFSHFLL